MLSSHTNTRLYINAVVPSFIPMSRCKNLGSKHRRVIVVRVKKKLILLNRGIYTGSDDVMLGKGRRKEGGEKSLVFKSTVEFPRVPIVAIYSFDDLL